jgi:hypothetical protein
MPAKKEPRKMYVTMSNVIEVDGVYHCSEKCPQVSFPAIRSSQGYCCLFHSGLESTPGGKLKRHCDCIDRAENE